MLITLKWCNALVIYDLTLLMILLCHLSVLSDFFHLLLKEFLEADIIHGIITTTAHPPAGTPP